MRKSPVRDPQRATIPLRAALAFLSACADARKPRRRRNAVKLRSIGSFGVEQRRTCTPFGGPRRRIDLPARPPRAAIEGDDGQSGRKSHPGSDPSQGVGTQNGRNLDAELDRAFRQNAKRKLARGRGGKKPGAPLPKSGGGSSRSCTGQVSPGRAAWIHTGIAGATPAKNRDRAGGPVDFRPAEKAANFEAKTFRTRA